MSLFSATIIYFQMNVKTIFSRLPIARKCKKTVHFLGGQRAQVPFAERTEGDIRHGDTDQADDRMADGLESPSDHTISAICNGDPEPGASPIRLFKKNAGRRKSPVGQIDPFPQGLKLPL